MRLAATKLECVIITTLLTSILNWLRAGYPEGVPGPDRVPLLALLRATPLTEDQVKEVVGNLTAADSPALANGEIKADEIEAFITDVTHYDAGPENVRRVAAKLAAAGWPLCGLDECGLNESGLNGSGVTGSGVTGSRVNETGPNDETAQAPGNDPE